MFNNHRFKLSGGLEGITYVNRPKPQEQDHFILIEEGTEVPDDCLAILDESSDIENAKVLPLVTGAKALTGQLNGSPYNSILATAQYNNHKKEEEQNYDSNSTGSGESNRGVSERSELDRIEDSPRGDGGQRDGSGESGTGEDNNSPVSGSSGVVEDSDPAVSGAVAEGARPVENHTGSFFGRVLSDGGRGDRADGRSIRQTEELHQESNVEVRRSIFSTIPSATPPSPANTANEEGLVNPVNAANAEGLDTPAADVSPASTANVGGLVSPINAANAQVDVSPVNSANADGLDTAVSPVNSANAQGLDTSVNSAGSGTPTNVTSNVSPVDSANTGGLDTAISPANAANTSPVNSVNNEEVKEDGCDGRTTDGSGLTGAVCDSELGPKDNNDCPANDVAREEPVDRPDVPPRTEVSGRTDVASGSPPVPDAVTTECIRVVDEQPPESAILPGDYTVEEKQLHNEFAEFLHMTNIPWTRQPVDESIVSELYCKENKWRYAKGYYIIDSLPQGRRYFYKATTGQLKGVRL